MMCIKIGLVALCLYFQFALICGQATTTEIVFNQNPQVIGSSVVASSNATYTSSSDTFINWSYNGTTVSGVQIKNNQALTLFNNEPTGKISLSASTTDPITTGDTFSMYFSVSNLASNESGIEIKLTCAGCSVVTRSKNLMVTGCQPDTCSGVLSTLSTTPCGYGCQVRYSCQEGFVGEDVTATCLENAVFNASAICEQISRSKPLSDGAIAGIVIGCLIAVALIIFFLIPIFCAEICCCAFSILCLSWGTKD